MNQLQSFLVQIRVDARKLMLQAASSGLLRHGADYGYYLHQQLLETFGKNVFSTFRHISTKSSYLTILAYSSYDADTLHEMAQTAAIPLRYSTIDWRHFASKPLPKSWPAGTRLKFEVKACPIVRIGSEHKKFRKGAEVDAFLASAESQNNYQISRETVYKDWLIKQFSRNSGACVETAFLNGFKRVKLLRRTHSQDRETKLLERPEASFTGVISVSDSDKFSEFLVSGVGRHNAFGFGMMLLAPLGR